VRNDPETLVGVMDDGDGFSGGGADGPDAAQEIEGVIGVDSALEVEGQMQIQQRHGGDRSQVGALFFEGQIPGGVGSLTRGAAAVMLIVPGDLGLEQGIGVFVVGDFFVSQQADESFLKGVEAAFDFAFGGRVGGDAVSGAQRGEGALELGMGVEAVGWGTMAEEREAIGVEAGGRAVDFNGRTQVHEMVPSGVAAHEGGGEDFAGMIIERENKHGIMIGWPPRVRRTVMLPEFTDGAGLPAAAGFGAALGGGNLLGKMLADIGGHGGAGTLEIVAAGQFVGQECEVKRLAVRQEVLEEIVGGLGPGCFVVAAGRGELEAGSVLQPLVAQFIKAGRTDHEPLGGGEGVECAVVEGGEDFLNEECGNAVSELLFFIAARVADGECCPQAPGSLSH